jgi:hypothetical protein
VADSHLRLHAMNSTTDIMPISSQQQLPASCFKHGMWVAIIMDIHGSIQPAYAYVYVAIITTSSIRAIASSSSSNYQIKP